MFNGFSGFQGVKTINFLHQEKFFLRPEIAKNDENVIIKTSTDTKISKKLNVQKWVKSRLTLSFKELLAIFVFQRKKSTLEGDFGEMIFRKIYVLNTFYTQKHKKAQCPKLMAKAV